jgi:hypothetical protein
MDDGRGETSWSNNLFGSMGSNEGLNWLKVAERLE